MKNELGNALVLMNNIILIFIVINLKLIINNIYFNFNSFSRFYI